MKRYKIIHQTTYDFPDVVQLLPHTLRLRPREGHELRMESSKLSIDPVASLRWHRDVEGNSVAIASFEGKTKKLNIESEILIQKYDYSPHDFLVADHAVHYPFSYETDDKISLAPYMQLNSSQSSVAINNWIREFWVIGSTIQTFSLLLKLNQRIYQSLSYSRREEEGVQAPEYTLKCGTGSCRDFASLFMAAAQQLGFAARFVSGYVSDSALVQSGSTHAWAEVFIPGAGWKGFDPTFGTIVGADHIAIAVARRPELVPPVAGDFYGGPESSMVVNVWVSDITQC